MLTYEELEAQMDIDMKFNTLNLEGALADCPKLIAKWLNIHRMYKAELAKFNNLMARQTITAKEYYKGQAQDPKVYRDKPFDLTINNQKELDLYIEQDYDVCVIKVRQEELKEFVYIVETLIENLKYRPNSIASIIEYRKYENGA